MVMMMMVVVVQRMMVRCVCAVRVVIWFRGVLVWFCVGMVVSW